MQLNNQLRKIMLIEYINKICHLPIKLKEIHKYLYNTYCNPIVFIYDYKDYNKTKRNKRDIELININYTFIIKSKLMILKFLCIDSDHCNDNYYSIGINHLHIHEDYYVDDDYLPLDKFDYNEVQISNLISTNDLDLISKYQIYKLRNYDTLITNFAKNKIINDLKIFYNKYNTYDYISLIILYKYLRTHCEKLNIMTYNYSLPKYSVLVDKDYKCLSIDENYDSNFISSIFDNIKCINHILYEKVLIGIDKLD
jgi:hypothetical protein